MAGPAVNALEAALRSPQLSVINRSFMCPLRLSVRKCHWRQSRYDRACRRLSPHAAPSFRAVIKPCCHEELELKRP